MELNDGCLTIQAVRSHSNDEKDKEGRYLRRETFSGTCQVHQMIYLQNKELTKSQLLSKQIQKVEFI